MKNLKVEKLILLFTMISILLTTTLSITVPILSANMNEYNKKSIMEANGGDLFIKSFYESKDFNEEISILKKEGYKVTYKKTITAFFQNSKSSKSSKFYAKLILGEQSLKKDEVILDSSMAKNLAAKTGDKISIKTDGGTKAYTVKEIEAMPKGVTNDETIIGYGKINESVSAGNLIYISGNTDGEALKQRIASKEDGYLYSSIKDKERRLKSETDVQLASFGILTTMGYILSSIVIITTSIMLIIRGQRDISIMKILSLKNKDIKNALRLELSIIVLLPIILSVLTTILVSNVLLKMNYIPQSISFIEGFGIFSKGIILNILFFEMFSNIPLLIIDDFKGLWLLRENEEKNGIVKKRVFIYIILLIPVMLFIYSVYIGSSVNLVTSLGIICIILIFLIISAVLMKILSSIHYRSQLLMYSFKNMKKNFLTFILLTVSFSITLVFIMITLTLNNNVKNSMNKSLTTALPYNYILLSKENLNLENILTKENGVEGYIKNYNSAGKVLNNNIKQKLIAFKEIKKEDYKLEFKMVEGEKLFKGKDGCLITSQYQKENKLKVGDILHIAYQNKTVDIKIKGVYDNSFIDSMCMLLPYRGYSNSSQFYIKAGGTKWMDKLGDSPLISVDILGSAISAYIGKFLNIFKALSLMVVFASLIFNINLLNITFIEERKEETVIRALGLGKGFISKVYIFKGSILIIVSCILSYGFYVSVSKLFLKLLGIKAVNSLWDMIVLLLCSLTLTAATFIYPFITMKKYNSYEFLREN
ncbi:MAG: FtsX-like permease family protein [Clostridium sp.]|uniref:ABC transporter permease n=1 Tax=Clostridium sp. TaxID=1506 RepID=UPI003D6D8F08